MNIRKATIEDISLIQELADVAFRHTYKVILSPEQMEYMIDWMYSTENLKKQMNELGHRYLLLSDDGGNYVGYGSFNIEEHEAKNGEADDCVMFHLQKIYVLPEKQGCGYGAILLNALENAMKEVAYPKRARYELNVNRNNKAVEFYEHMGLYKDREGDFDIGDGFYMNDYIMAKKL